MFPSERQITAAVGAGDQIYYLTLPAGKKAQNAAQQQSLSSAGM